MNEPQVEKRKTFVIKLTKYELLHIRDMFSISLPVEMRETVSQALAKSQNRTLIESKLWQKITQLCDEAELPIGEDAPDFVVATASAPSIGVFELAHDPSAGGDTQVNDYGDDKKDFFDAVDENEEDVV